MEASSQGAKSVGGLTIGILPGNDRTGISDAIDVAIITGMGSARNQINVLSSGVVIACGSGAGTVSEIALALKAKKPVILLNVSIDSQRFFQSISPSLRVATEVAEAIALVRQFLATAF